MLNGFANAKRPDKIGIMKLKSINSLFDPAQIKHELRSFHLDQILDLPRKRKLIRNWVNEIQSGKIMLLKEEEVKHRFLMDIFGTVLRYTSSDPINWNQRPEFKSLVDGTKPDSALGYFKLFEDSIVNEVAVVIEIKDAGTDLDEKLPGSQSAVEQAFTYAHKTKAKWVIVSNFLVIRFYSATFSGEYEPFNLVDLIADDELKRFFLLLDRSSLLHGTKSRVARMYDQKEESAHNNSTYISKQILDSDHIVDQLDQSLNQFEGMGCIDPHLLAHVKPFSVLDDHVWHYEQFRLFTLNSKIYQLLQGIEVEDEGITLSDDLIAELESIPVTNYRTKIEKIISRLNHSMINMISVVRDFQEIQAGRSQNSIGFSIRHIFGFSEDQNEGLTKAIYRQHAVICDCVSCNFRSLDLKRLAAKLSSHDDHEPDLEYAFGNYLFASKGFRKACETYLHFIEVNDGNSAKRLELFLSYYNLTRLYNLVAFYKDTSNENLINRLKAIDLDDIICENFQKSDGPLREMILELRDDQILRRSKKRVDKLLEQVKTVKDSYSRGSSYISVGNYTSELHHELCLVYSFYNRNYLVGDAYSNYQDIVSSCFEGLLISQNLEKYPYRLPEFQLFHLIEVTLNVQSEPLRRILETQGTLVTNKEDLKKFIPRLFNFLSSFYEEVMIGEHPNQYMQEHLLTYDFENKCGNIFSNLFQILTYTKIDQDQWDSRIGLALTKFLKTEDFLHWHQLQKLGEFIEKHGNLFVASELIEVLKISNQKSQVSVNKYQYLIRSVCRALSVHHPDYKVNNEAFILKALANAVNDNGQVIFDELIPITHIVGAESRAEIINFIEERLKKNFHLDRYEDCIREKVLTVSNKELFNKYLIGQSQSSHKGFLGVVEGKPQFQDFYFYNFALLLYSENITLDREQLSLFKDHSQFEQWLLNPHDFDYNQFDVVWLYAVQNKWFLDKLKGIPKIKQVLHDHLIGNHDAVLSQLYFNIFG